MDVIASGDWVHCGREFSAQEVADVCATVAWLPGLARRELAACRTFGLLVTGYAIIMPVEATEVRHVPLHCHRP